VISGELRVKMDALWEDPTARKEFEKECKIDPLAEDEEGKSIDLFSGHAADYIERFMIWCVTRFRR